MITCLGMGLQGNLLSSFLWPFSLTFPLAILGLHQNIAKTTKKHACEASGERALKKPLKKLTESRFCMYLAGMIPFFTIVLLMCVAVLYPNPYPFDEWKLDQTVLVWPANETCMGDEDTVWTRILNTNNIPLAKSNCFEYSIDMEPEPYWKHYLEDKDDNHHYDDNHNVPQQVPGNLHWDKGILKGRFENDTTTFRWVDRSSTPNKVTPRWNIWIRCGGSFFGRFFYVRLSGGLDVRMPDPNNNKNEDGGGSCALVSETHDNRVSISPYPVILVGVFALLFTPLFSSIGIKGWRHSREQHPRVQQSIPLSQMPSVIDTQ